MESTLRFKYHDDYLVNRMKLAQSIEQSCNTFVGMATDELNLERNGKMSGRKSLREGSGLKSGV